MLKNMEFDRVLDQYCELEASHPRSQEKTRSSRLGQTEPLLGVIGQGNIGDVVVVLCSSSAMVSSTSSTPLTSSFAITLRTGTLAT